MRDKNIRDEVKRIRRAVRPPLVISANALDGHGKSSLLFSAPKPLHVFHIDPNTEELFEKLVREKEVRRSDVELHAVEYPATVFGSRDEIADDATRAWEDSLIEPLKDVIADDGVKSIGLDTATELFELKLMADHGKTIQIMPEMRTKTNYVFKGLLRALQRSGKHIILLHRLRDVWRSTTIETSRGEEERRDKVPGMYEREGFNRTGFHVNLEIYLMLNSAREGTEYNKFGVRIGRCLQRPSLVTCQADQAEFWNLDDKGWLWGREKIDGSTRVKRASIPYLATKIFPDSTLEEWQ